MARIALLFPGQGAQAVGMGRGLVEQLPEARALFEQAGEILGYDLTTLCFEGPVEKLNSTVVSQPALFVTSLAALEKLRAESPEVVEQCQAAAGLSLGEYTAMVFAGAMTFEDGLRVVQRRGEAMQQAADATPSGMVSILGLEHQQVEAICARAAEGQTLQVANLLCPGNIAVSGQREACRRAAQLAEQQGAMKVVPLAVAGAFHSPIMQSAVEELTDVLAKLPLRPPRISVVSNVDAQPHDDPERIRELLLQQLVSPVRWEESMRYLIEQGFDTFYEVGPGRVLRGLLKRIDRKLSCETIC